MKKLVALIMLITLSTFARDNSEKVLEAAKKNIIQTLYGVNENLQFEALCTLRELNKQYPRLSLSESLPALFFTLCEHRSYSVRIMAALAISEIDVQAGSTALLNAKNNDSSIIVRRICAELLR